MQTYFEKCAVSISLTLIFSFSLALFVDLADDDLNQTFKKMETYFLPFYANIHNNRGSAKNGVSMYMIIYRVIHHDNRKVPVHVSTTQAVHETC